MSRRWVVVNETDGPEIKVGSQTEEIERAEEDIPANDDDSPIHRTYQFDNCHVYMNSFNVRGIKVKNSGNNTPRVTRMSCFFSILMQLSMTDPFF